MDEGRIGFRISQVRNRTCQGGNELTLTIPSSADPATVWSTVTDLTKWQKIAPSMTDGAQPAVAAWAFGPAYDHQYTVGKNTSTATRQDIFQISLLADDHGTIPCDIQSFGIAEEVPGAVAGQLLPGEPPYTQGNTTYTGVVSGIFDAPFPMPSSDVSNNHVKTEYDSRHRHLRHDAGI
jgi:hypothetical protein